MKKTVGNASCIIAQVTKCLLMMKMTILLICFFSLQSVANDSFAQETITLRLENASLRKAFKVIEKQTSFRFVYNEEVLPVGQNVNISVKSQPLPEVMKKLLEKTALTFKLVGSDLVVISAGANEEVAAVRPPAFIVSGEVVNANNQPLEKVSILEKGTSNGTTTKEDGRFTLDVAGPNAVLVVSSIGFVLQEIPVNGRANVTIKLAESTDRLNEVVVVGYGTQKRSDVTGSVASVPKSRLSQLPVTNILHAIEGSVAGVNITQTSSVPGSSADALVRGVNSISAATGPFVVLDGIPYSTTGGTINDINPNDIASIEILKDASAVAIYGTRGANGVILITTKRGTSGKPVIKYNVYGGWENMSHRLESMGAEKYVQKYADWKTQSGVVNNDAVPTIAEKANYAMGKTTDWLDEVSRQGYIFDHNLSISGGTKDVKYYVSGDYLKQQGVLKDYQYNRASIRSNLDVNITDYLSAGVNLFFASNNYDGGRINLTQASQMSPYGQLYNPDGTYYIYPMFTELLYTNPLLGLYHDRLDRGKNISGNVFAELKPGFVKGLKYRVNAAYTYVPTRGSNYSGRNANSLLGSASFANSETNTWVVENILSYTKDWDKHHIDVTALYSAQQTEYFSSTGSATGFINDLLSYNNLGAGATQSDGSNKYKSNLLSQMGRVNYAYDSRYLFTITARRDGYSAFGSNTTKYGLFPSVAVAWNIGNENFMKNVALVNSLKLRGSYGLSGNQAVGVNQTTTTSSTVRLPYNGVSTIGVIASVLGNADLNWESTYGANVGIDFSILKNRISGTIEAYSTSTKDLLLFRSLPTITGYTRVLDNLGKVSNKGIEITVNAIPVQTASFRWEASVNYSANRNKIVDLYGDKKDDVGNRWFIGQPVNVIYDYRVNGVWQVGETVGTFDPGAQPGWLKFADINGPAGKPDGVITADDRTVIGSPLPKWIGGLTNAFHYRNLHLSIFIQTFQGAVKNNPVLTNADQAGIINVPDEIEYWTAANKHNSRPSIAYKNPRGYNYPSDASYTRIKDITLSYTAPQQLLDKVKLAALTFYVSGRNIHTFTNWIGWDPENNYDRGTAMNFNNYPLVRTIVIGASISLR
jgi:TonB-linked SusC/RagA family outer membrane protein